MERKVNYVRLGDGFCKVCNKNLLHEFGYCPTDKSWYKRCLKCEEVTFVGKDK